MQSAYRTFRDEVLGLYRADLARKQLWGQEDEIPRNGLTEMRRQISFFRGWVYDHFGEMLADDKTDERLLRKALGIPPTLPLLANPWPWWRYVAQFFAPHPFVFRHIRSQLSQVRSFEGRDYLYTHVYARLFAHHELRSYSPGLDIVLRKFPMQPWNELTGLWRQESEWVVAAWRLGLRQLKDIEPYASHSGQRTPGWFALLMVNEGIVQSTEELDWLRYPQDGLGFHRHENWLQHEATRSIARLLLRFGMERRRIASLHRFTYWQSDPAQLADNLALLRNAGVEDLTGVFDTVDDRLWRTKAQTWRLVADVIGARTPEEMRQLSTLIECGTTPPMCVVLHLQARGADLEALAHCQEMLLAPREETDPNTVVAAIDLLLASPHGLTFPQLGKCSDYVKSPGALGGFLAVLTEHGYSSPTNVLAFQICYRSVSAAELDTWLSIVGVRGKGMKPELVAEWVCRMRSGGHSDAYKYLLTAVPVVDFNALKQAEPLVVFGRDVLRYLIEDKQLETLSVLRKWYFNARSVQGLCWWGSRHDEVFLLLMDDAYQRQNYAFVMHNRSCINEVVDDRVKSTSPCPPHTGTKEDFARHHAEIEVKREIELRRLIPVLPIVLEKTGGILLASVLRGDSVTPEELLARIATLEPMIDQLLMGQGPKASTLDELEEEVISLVYRTSVDTVRRAWTLTHGRESDLVGLALEPCYPLAWQRSRRRLQAPLERSSLLALTRANRYASLFDDHRYNDCRFFLDLQSKRLLDPARDPWSLAAHLGLLLAAARDDSEIRHWRVRGFDEVAGMAEEGAQAFEHMEQLDKLFGCSLPDALDKSAQYFLSCFSDDKAEKLTQRLVDAAALEGLTDPADRLRKAFELVRENVLAVCWRWVAREKGKFGRANDKSSQTLLHAVLTKHPAAYFAKHATNLCSRDRDEMWREARHAHLTVFDLQQQRLVGMALVNIEVVAAIHPERKSLVIRAINPMEDMLATHTEASIVESCLDVAIQIADRNGLAAVLLPWHNGAHLLSNLRPIEKHLEKYYLNKAQTVHDGWRGNDHTESENENWRAKPRKINARFSAYEDGQEIVGTLCAIWCGNTDETKERREELAAELA